MIWQNLIQTAHFLDKKTYNATPDARDQIEVIWQLGQQSNRVKAAQCLSAVAHLHVQWEVHS